MAFELIPFPISVVFILVFVLAVEVALWRMRRNGRLYRWVFNLGVVFGAVVIGLALLLLLQPLL
jgi:ABC-type spermidine/putrescine transport system permease subunit II